MYKKFLIAPLIILFSSCSSNNSVVRNPITGEKPNPGLFSKDAKKGLNLSEILSVTLKLAVNAGKIALTICVELVAIQHYKILN